MQDFQDYAFIKLWDFKDEERLICAVKKKESHLRGGK